MAAERVSGAGWEKTLAVARTLPYVELHQHLDGSLLPEFVAARAEARGIPDAPAASRVRSFLFGIKQKEGLPAARAWCAQFLQTEAEVVEGVRGVVAAAAAASCVHFELRLCPHAHTSGGLSPQAVVAAAASGFAAGARGTPLRGGLLLSVRAGRDEAAGHEAVLLAAQWAGRGVLGVELAAEADPPVAREMGPLRAVARSAAAADVALTVHVSDEGCAGPPASPAASAAQRAAANAAWALQLGAQRLSGGLAAFARDTYLADSVARAAVTLELCLSDTVRPGAPGWPGSYGEHPARALAAHKCTPPAGEGTPLALLLAPCVGHALLSGGEGAWGAEPAAELAHLVRHCGLGWQGVRGMMVAAARGAFLGPPRDGASPADQRRRFVAEYEKKLDAALAAAGAFATEGCGDDATEGSPKGSGAHRGAPGGASAVYSPPGWAAEGAGAPPLVGGALLPRSSARAARAAAERSAAGILRPPSPPPAPGRAQPAPIAQRTARAAASMPAPRSGEDYTSAAALPPVALPPPPAPPISWSEAFSARPTFGTAAQQPAAVPRSRALPPAPPPPPPPPLAASLGGGGGSEPPKAAMLRAPAIGGVDAPQRSCPATSLPPAVAPLRLPPLDEALATVGLGGSTAQAAWDSAGAAAASAAVAAIAAASAALGRPIVPAAPQWVSPSVPRATPSAATSPASPASPAAAAAPQSPLAAAVAGNHALRNFAAAQPASPPSPSPMPLHIPYAPRASAALEAASLGAARALEQASAAVEAANAAVAAAAASALPPQYVPRAMSRAGAASSAPLSPSAMAGSMPSPAAAAVAAAREAIAALRAAAATATTDSTLRVAGGGSGPVAPRIPSAEAVGAASAALAAARAAAVRSAPRRVAAAPDPSGIGIRAAPRGQEGGGASGDPSYGTLHEPDMGDIVEAALADYEQEEEDELPATPEMPPRPKSAGSNRPYFREGTF